MTRFISLTLTSVLGFGSVLAQTNLNLNTSDELSSNLAFHNPAGIAWTRGGQGVIGMQLLYAGVAGDHLRNTIASYAHALAGGRALGARAVYFTSNLLQQGSFSALLAQSFFEQKFNAGINFNLLTVSFNRDQFKGFDANDPLVANGTSRSVFSMGLGILWQPVWPLAFGASVDHLNRPDISLDHSGFKKRVTYKAGISFQSRLVSPRFDLEIVGNEVRSQATVGSRWLEQKLRVEGGLDFLGSESGNFFTEVVFAHKNFGIGYNLQYPLNDLNSITDGSHRVTLHLNRSGLAQFYPRPVIELLQDENVVVDTSRHAIAASITGAGGVSTVKIVNNGEVVWQKSFAEEPKTISLKETIELAEGKNAIQITARAGRASRTLKLYATYVPPRPSPDITQPAPSQRPPVITLASPREDETITSQSVMRLECGIENVTSSADVLLKLNGNRYELNKGEITRHTPSDVTVRANLDLREGENRVEIHAFNAAGHHSSRELRVLYNPMADSMLYRRTWAVVIGIDKYRDPLFKELSYAVTDARAVETSLKKNFQVDHVITLFNEAATRERIIAALSDSLRNTEYDDRVFIFFAGHGYTDKTREGGDLGFIVPHDGAWKSYAQNISMLQIRETARILQAKHVFYVIDACYSGLLLTTRGPSPRPKTQIDYRYLWRATSKPARFILTAGQKDQQVLDGGRGQHSIFTSRLLEGLEGNADANNDYHITATELSVYVKEKVAQDAKLRHAQQEPNFGTLISDDGEFIFVRRFD